jgi:DNA polymerase
MRAEAASALLWWIEAGVDTIVDEAPRDWLAASRDGPDRPAVPPAEPAALPDTIEAMKAWLTSGDAQPLAAGGAPRLGPEGDPTAGLMVLVDMPAQVDVSEGRLLAGEAGALFDKMMAAIGRSRETLWLAPMSPVRTPSGRLDTASGQALAEIVRHHISLVNPKALLLLRDACSKALLGEPLTRSRGRWHRIGTRAGEISTLVTIRPEKLVAQPGLKKHAWDDLKMLRDELAK